MADRTGIEWAHHTWSPWVGCTKVSPACDHCYAESWAKRSGQPALWQGDRRRTSAAAWAQLRKWDRAAAAAGERRRVFPSLCDPFDNQVLEAHRLDMWTAISLYQNLDFLLLTKRPQNIARMLPPDWGSDGYPNVWLGTTAENQDELRRRTPHVLAVPAPIHFLSCEPMLSALDLGEAWHGESALDAECWGDCNWCAAGHPPLHNCQRGRQSEAVWLKGRSGFDWVICGGESGPGARPMHPDWARSLRDQCRRAETPFFFKQWGEYVPCEMDLSRRARRSVVTSAGRHLIGIDMVTCHPEDADAEIIAMVGKKHAGRLLDGVEYNAIPRAA